MEIVKNSDIAQLVLSYLRDQNLEQTAYSFCKTSPYLKNEYRLLKKGFKTMSLGSGTLVDIIKEHCQIKSRVSQIIDLLPIDEKECILKQNTIVNKVSYLLKKLIQQSKLARQQNNENNRNNMKRARSIDSVQSLEATQIKDLPGHDKNTRYPKRRRISGSYFFVSNSTMINELSTEDNCDDDDDDDELLSSDDTDISNIQMHQTLKTNGEIEQSTSSIDNSTASTNNTQNDTIPVLSETILKRTEFQNILVENINKALQTSSQANSNDASQNNENSTVSEQTENQKPNDTEDALNIELDEMIKKILDATEKNPIFDEVIEEVVNITSSAKKSQASNRGNQISPQRENTTTATNKFVESTKSGNAVIKSCSKSIQMASSRETEYPQFQILTSNNVSSPYSKAILGTSVSKTSSTGTNETATLIPVVDSNLQSKFILINSNDSLGTLGGDGAILSCANLNNVQTFTSNDQVYIDLNTGQMSIPLIMSNDNLAVPILINSNDIITQQQSDNNNTESEATKTTNGDTIETQTQGPTTNETINFQQETKAVPESITESCNNTVTTNPLDSNIVVTEKTTPYDNLKIPIIRSFSTPRRRASHIRVLNFGTPNRNQDQLSKDKQRKQEELIFLTEDEEIRNSDLPSVGKNIEIKSITNEMTSNSSSLDFSTERSNQTVIQKQIPDTPKRSTRNQNKLKEKCNKRRILNDKKKIKVLISPLKSKKAVTKKKNNLKKAKTNNSKSKSKEDKNESIPKNPTLNDNDDNNKGLDPLEEWNRMRATFSNPNWDHHLRSIQSKTVEQPTNKIKKRNKSPKKASKSKNKTNEENDKNLKKPEQEQEEMEKREDEEKSSLKVAEEKLNKKKPIKKSSSPKARQRLMKFKIPTPVKKSTESQKVNEKDDGKTNSVKNSSTESTNSNANNNKETICDSTPMPLKVVTEPPPLVPILVKSQSSSNLMRIPSSTFGNNSNSSNVNMAMLLQTPYKTDTFQIPITPRFTIPTDIEQQTPITKMMRTIQLSSNEKQGTLDNLSTPNFAITPGSGLLTSTDKETPATLYTPAYSNRPTDYSSSNSYYKPDESEDLDQHLDRLLLAERKKKSMKSSVSSSTAKTEETLKPVENSIEKEPQQSETKSSLSLRRRHSSRNLSDSKNITSSKSESDLLLSDINSSEDENLMSDSIKNENKPGSRSKLNTSFSKKNTKVKEKETANELEKKRLRIKEKLKNDFPTKTSQAISTTMTARTTKVSSIDTITKRKIIKKEDNTLTTKSIVEEKYATKIVAGKKIVTTTKASSLPSDGSSHPPSLSLLETKTAITSNTTKKREISITAEQKLSNSSLISVTASFERNSPNNHHEISNHQMDVLKALNLSAKKLPNSNTLQLSLKPVVENKNSQDSKSQRISTTFIENDNAVTEEVFEQRDHISKIQSSALITSDKATNEAIYSIVAATTDDSRESGESDKIRNAAMALTTLQKKLASQINNDKIRKIQQHQQQRDKEKILSTLNIPSTIKTGKCTKLIDPQRAPLESQSSKRAVKLTPKAKSLSMKISKGRIGKHYESLNSQAIRTRSSKRLENTSDRKQSGDCKPISKPIPSKSKKSTKKSLSVDIEEHTKYQNSNDTIKLSPIMQPKVVLEIMTDDQLYISKPEKENKGEDRESQERYEQKENLNNEISQKSASTRNIEIMKTGNEVNVEETPSTTNAEEEDQDQSENEQLTSINDINDNNDDEEREEEEEEEEDPYDECEMITIDESDPKRFIKIQHSDDHQPNRDLISYDRNVLKTEMKIFLNDIPHNIKITDEIELFSKNSNDAAGLSSEQNNLVENSETTQQQQQQQRRVIKNIPKKREKSAHILHYNDRHQQQSSLPSTLHPSSSSAKDPSATEITRNQESDNDNNSDGEDDGDDNENNDAIEEPSLISSTSIPCKPKFRIHYKDKTAQGKFKKKCNKKISKTTEESRSSKIHPPTTTKVVSIKNYDFVANKDKGSDNDDEDEQQSQNIQTQEQKQQEGQKQQQPASSSSPTSSDDLTKTLRQEDIYAVLSHVHGTD